MALAEELITYTNSNKICCRTGFDSENSWIYANWTGFIREEDIRNWSVQFLDLLRQTKTQKLLNNNLEVRSTWRKANTWIVEELIPVAISEGLKALAHIIPTDPFAADSASDLERKINYPGFTMMLFNNSEQAKNWLQSF
ncbi:hypothetical protein [Rubrolithibacter danxiaensis]|uniref:hypothetical protein n=1 Tax=Rubrolithibacter danxiaensis TaxID=3390805 RepID=UPI003BF79643